MSLSHHVLIACLETGVPRPLRNAALAIVVVGIAAAITIDSAAASATAAAAQRESAAPSLERAMPVHSMHKTFTAEEHFGARI